MTEAVSAKGTRVYVKINETWKELKEVSATPEVGQSAEKIDVTHLTSEMKEYIKDIPDYSSDLEFTMNCMPSGVTDSNLDLILGLDEDATYSWKIEYAQLNKEITLSGEYTYKIGAGAVSSKQDLVLTVIPKSAYTVADISTTNSLTLEGQQEVAA